MTVYEPVPFYSTLDRMVDAMSHPAYASLACIVSLMGVIWALIEGSIELDSSFCEIACAMAFALSSFCICGFIAWVVHAITHHLVLAEQERQPETLIEAMTVGPWNSRKICGAILMPFYWCHAMHHHPDKSVSQGTDAQIAEVFATGFAGGAYTILLASMYPTALHLGSAIAFFVTYVSVHLVNFHYKWTDVHMFHHEDANSNLSPNLYDILFGTTNHVEDVWHQTPNILIGCVIAIAWQTLKLKEISKRFHRIHVSAISI